MDAIIQTIVIAALPVILAITLHEAAHGYAARHFGDMTAWQAGRVSANPIRHIDPLGSIAVPVGVFLASGGSMLFGWAKPVPVNPDRLRRQEVAWVALAGPAANLVMALGWGAVGKVAESISESVYAFPLGRMADAGIEWNVVLMVLNLLPIPPLDGGRIVQNLLPRQAAWKFGQLEPWGIPLLLILMVAAALGGPNILGYMLGPIVGLLRYGIAVLFQFQY